MSQELETSLKITTGIDIIDNLMGGYFGGHIHSIQGDSGVGKSWLCQRVIRSLFETNSNASVLYSDFSGNVRFRNLQKTLGGSEFLDQVNFFRPSKLLDNIILTKKIANGYLPHISLLVLDTIFGSPMQFIELFGKSKKKWKRTIFSFMLDLRKIAQIRKIPIIVTHNMLSEASNKGYTKDLFLDHFCTTKSVLQKSDNNSSLQFYAYNQFLGSTIFKLFSE
jgi:hypothetical protein